MLRFGDYVDQDRDEGRLAAIDAMKRSWNWKELRKHPNKAVRKAAAANLAHGRQTVTQKRSIAIGTHANYFGGGKVGLAVSRGNAVAGTGKPVGA